MKNLIVLIGALIAAPGAVAIGMMVYSESGDVGATLACMGGMAFAGIMMIGQAGEMK